MCYCRVKDHYNLLHYSPLLKTACVRQVVLDKWFPMILRGAGTTRGPRPPAPLRRGVLVTLCRSSRRRAPQQLFVGPEGSAAPTPRPGRLLARRGLPRALFSHCHPKPSPPPFPPLSSDSAVAEPAQTAARPAPELDLARPWPRLARPGVPLARAAETPPTRPLAEPSNPKHGHPTDVHFWRKRDVHVYPPNCQREPSLRRGAAGARGRTRVLR